MKKFLKVAIIVLLVIGAIGGTVYFFFRNHKEKSSKTESIVNMVKSESKTNFNNSLSNIKAIANSDSTDVRLDVIIETNAKLDEIVYVLSSYYLNSNTVINNKDIKNQLDTVNSLRSTMSSMMTEYNIKKDSVYFDRHLGLNDLYKTSCDYVENYAKFAGLLCDNVSGVNKKADIKFAMFELYVDIVENTFAKTKTDANNLEIIEDASNINLINSEMQINNSYIVTDQAYTTNAVNFVNYYYSCDKQAFAKNLATNVAAVNSSLQPNNELIATYYFKTIYGI